jgi:drug/metabolite transporter (DMT)-like permease
MIAADELAPPPQAAMITSAAAPVLLALLASASFGAALVVTQFGLRHVTAADGALVSIPTTTVLFWALSPFMLDSGGWQVSAVAIFAAVGLFFPAAVTLLTFEANHRMGPTVSGAVGGTAPLFAAVLAVLFLGERLTLVTAAATLAVVAGIVILSWRPRMQPARWPAWALLLPLAAAMLRGLAQAGTKLGLALWPSAFAASLIGYSVSVVSIALDARLRRGRRHGFTHEGVLWFALVGVCNGAAVLSMYAALARGAVTVVAPVVATYPLFSLLLGGLLLPDQRVTPRSAAGTALMVAGEGALILGHAG